MKKYLFTLIAMTTLMGWFNVSTASAQSTKVWITTGKSATKYHKQKDCRAIKRLDPSTIKQLTITEAKNSYGRSECLFCYGKTAAATTTTKKVAEKKVAEKKPAETKAEKATTEKLVWVTTEGQATKYHKTKTCRALKGISATTLKKVDVTEAEGKMGRSECLFCYGKASSEASAKKVAAKKTTTKATTTKAATTKTTTKKAETTAKEPAAKKTTTSTTATKKATTTKDAAAPKKTTTKKTVQKAA